MRVAILAVALALSASAEAHDLDCHGNAGSRGREARMLRSGRRAFRQHSAILRGSRRVLALSCRWRRLPPRPGSAGKHDQNPAASERGGLLYGLVPGVERSSGIFVPGEIRSGMSQDEVRFYCLEIPSAM